MSPVSAASASASACFVVSSSRSARSRSTSGGVGVHRGGHVAADLPLELDYLLGGHVDVAVLGELEGAGRS